MLLEYALGLDPLAADTVPQQVAEALPAGTVRFVYERHAGREDLRITPMLSDDLQAWSAAVVVSETIEPMLGSDRERVALELNAPFDSSAKAFLRLEVERQTQQVGDR